MQEKQYSNRVGLTTKEELEAYKKKLVEKESQRSSYQFSFKKCLSSGIHLLSIAILLMITSNILLQRATGQIPHIFDYYLFRVESSSMTPTLNVGDIILCKSPKDSTNLDVGTIVTYRTSDDTIVTHRIINKIEQNSSECIAYETKGDHIHNSVDLELLEPDRIIAIFQRKLYSKSN